MIDELNQGLFSMVFLIDFLKKKKDFQFVLVGRCESIA